MIKTFTSQMTYLLLTKFLYEVARNNFSSLNSNSTCIIYLSHFTLHFKDIYLLDLSDKLYFKTTEDRSLLLNIYLSPNTVPYYKVFNELKI